jgi:DNA-directed RNA polymerase subunit RPC12/RpoP
MVLPAIRKLCAGCGADVTRGRRTRDESGEYFCPDCWAAQPAARGGQVSYACHTCGQSFTPDQVYQDRHEVICVGCYEQRTLDPDALLEVAAHAGDDAPAVFATPRTYRRRSEPPWGWISLGIAVLVATIAAVALLSLR